MWSQDEAKCSERIPSSDSVLLWKQVPFRFGELSQQLGESSPFVELFSIVQMVPIEPFSSSSLNHCAILAATFPVGVLYSQPNIASKT